jgi:peptide/nickel transport system permease protein
MHTYIIKRLLLAIPTVCLVTIAIFLVIRLVPGDIVDLMVQEMGYYTDTTREKLVHMLGLDVPIFVQFGRWMKNLLLHGDLGTSLWKRTPVLEEVLTRWPVTLELSLLGLVVAQLIALPVGIISAIRQDTWGDYLARSFAIGCIAVPGFWLGTMIIVFPSIWWGYSPPISLIPFSEDPIGNLEMFIIPSILLGLAMSGLTMRMTRTMMLEVLRQDYIRTAWAKGQKERAVVMRHALKNAIIPVITIIGFQMRAMIGGTVIIENIFCLPGLGRLMVDSTQLRDYPIVSGVLLFFTIGMVLINLVIDITYGFLDPRIRYK